MVHVKSASSPNAEPPAAATTGVSTLIITVEKRLGASISAGTFASSLKSRAVPFVSIPAATRWRSLHVPFVSPCIMTLIFSCPPAFTGVGVSSLSPETCVSAISPIQSPVG